MKERFIELLEEVLEKNKNTIVEEDDFRQYEEWDSLVLLSLVAMIEEEYDITIPAEDFSRFQSVADICNYIQLKKS
ncbi:MAG: acyl carrier protein [bacterium]|nr:acyl carrier protein [bacterium]